MCVCEHQNAELKSSSVASHGAQHFSTFPGNGKETRNITDRIPHILLLQNQVRCGKIGLHGEGFGGMRAPGRSKNNLNFSLVSTTSTDDDDGEELQVKFSFFLMSHWIWI